MKHKHANLIHAWADGANIEFNRGDGTWEHTHHPSWDEDIIYRIKVVPRFRVLYIDEGYSTPQASRDYFESLEEFSRNRHTSRYKPLQLLESQREIL